MLNVFILCYHFKFTESWAISFFCVYTVGVWLPCSHKKYLCVIMNANAVHWSARTHTHTHKQETECSTANRWIYIFHICCIWVSMAFGHGQFSGHSGPLSIMFLLYFRSVCLSSPLFLPFLTIRYWTCHSLPPISSVFLIGLQNCLNP